MVTQAPLNQILNDGQTVKGLRKHGLLLACLLLGFAVAAQGWADVIVLQPLDSTRSGVFSNLDPPQTHQQIADNFSLSQATVLESISWFGRYGAVLNLTNPVAFSVRFFAEAGGLPSVFPLAVFDVMVDALDTGRTFGGTPFFSYSNALALALNPGTYWVSVVESDPRSPPFGGSQWLWGQSGTAGARAVRVSDGITWTVGTGAPDQAFTLAGKLIPEPSCAILISVGWLALRAFQRRKPVHLTHHLRLLLIRTTYSASRHSHFSQCERSRCAARR